MKKIPSPILGISKMRCPHCGQEHPKKFKVCPITGNSLIESQPETEVDIPTLTNDIESTQSELPPGNLVFKKKPAPIRSLRRRQWTKFILVVLSVVIGVAILAAAGYYLWRKFSSRQESQAASLAVQISMGLTQTAMALTTNMPAQPSTSAAALPSVTPIPMLLITVTQLTNEPVATTTLPTSTTAPGLAFSPTVTTSTLGLGLTSTSNPSIPTSALGLTSTPSLSTIAANPLAPPDCPGTLPSRLSAGANAKVSDVVYILNMREEPGVHSLVVGSLQPNDQVQVLNDTPVCADNYLWWHIQSTQDNLNGWAAEGGVDQYWLIP